MAKEDSASTNDARQSNRCEREKRSGATDAALDELREH
jgi:hypothetical protein